MMVKSNLDENELCLVVGSYFEQNPTQLANDFQELGMQKKELEIFPSKRKKAGR